MEHRPSVSGNLKRRRACKGYRIFYHSGRLERLGVRFIALILSLIVCGAVIVALVKMNPVDVYRAIWDGAMGTERRMWMTIRDTMVLLCIAIGLAPAFKMKFWNIGAEGQILIGGACSAAVMIYAGDKMSPVLLLIVMLIASILGGMIWGMIPSVFKAYWNTNETLFTLMLNYVAMQVVTYCIVFRDEYHVLDSDSEKSGQIDAGLRCDKMSGGENLFRTGRYARLLVKS